MLEDLLGRASWPLAVMFAALVAGITVYNVNESNHKDDVRKACIAQHGVLGEHNGWPTCTYTEPK